MSNTPHTLAQEFPDYSDMLHALKTSNAHFNVLAAKYDEVNLNIHKAETNIEPADDFTIVAMRKERLSLLDEIAGMLRDATKGEPAHST